MNTVYIIDPYYPDSHRYWAEQIANNLKAEVRIFHQPPVHWKWKMEGAAIELAKEINQCEIIPDAFLVTDYLNLALFKSLLDPRFLKSKFVVYMHENQLTYPFSDKDSDITKSRDNHYGFINYTSCLVADSVAFNSQYHLNVFMEAVQKLSNRLPDNLEIRSIINKSIVIPSIISTDGFIDRSNQSNSPKSIVWNHRWDYDKRPDVFLNAMVELKARGIEFQLILLGRMDDQTQKEYTDQLNKLKDQIIHIGFAESRDSYFQLLAKGDIIFSTSIHDFLGLSVVEGIYAGCRPVLPYDLAYPELVDPILKDQVFYERDKLIEFLTAALREEWPSTYRDILRKYIEDNFTWYRVEEKYEELLFN